ncbi:hypothetical protein CDD80_4967 [Ophiocordyceps camponoti-rufipedis]|uniref:Uncharacterized protein n=1 Tax=Ophiocordyceps camponoti-rufipedis TaxID=2004952 RepID=A0A2C5YY33_9HYPO|nr:hypothetical protein CDD80_4967 [Ophiocordyceps camponoti-rufipedis]
MDANGRNLAIVLEVDHSHDIGGVHPSNYTRYFPVPAQPDPQVQALEPIVLGRSPEWTDLSVAMQRVIIDILLRQQKTLKQCFTTLGIGPSSGTEFLAGYVATRRIGRVMDSITDRDVVDGRFFLSVRGFDYVADEVDGFLGPIDLARLRLPLVVNDLSPGPFEDRVRRREVELREAAERVPAPEPDPLELFSVGLGLSPDPEVMDPEVEGLIREEATEEEAQSGTGTGGGSGTGSRSGRRG